MHIECWAEDFYFVLDLPTGTCCLICGPRTRAFIVHSQVIDENLSRIILLGFFSHWVYSGPASPKVLLIGR